MFRLFPVILVLVDALASAAPLMSQQAPDSPWTFRTRVFATGESHSSSPRGFKAYSGLGVEVELDRRMANRLSIALIAHAESREIDSLPTSGPPLRQGAIEFLPLTVAAQFRPWTGRVTPYLGLGGTLTVAWEKSGLLDSLDVSAAVGPAIQAGLDWRLSSTTSLNFDVRWNGQRSTIRTGGKQLYRLNVDPLTIGLGLAFHL